MAVFLWSALANGAKINFNPNVDVLRFDDASINAAAVSAGSSVGTVDTEFSYHGKTVTLLASSHTITTTNVTFASGSMFVVGDNTTSTATDNGDNTVTGGAGADLLIGAGGNDTMNGGAGNDNFQIAPNYNTGIYGNDTMNGGDGQDHMFWNVTNGYGVNVNLATGVANGGDAPAASSSVLTLSNIEDVTATMFNDSLIGNASNNTLHGMGGADTIFGGDGNDWIDGESGNSLLPSNQTAGNDTLHGEGGDDVILAGGGNDTVYGGSGTDFLIGETGNDLMYGGSEWDAIDGRQGSDVLHGEGGADIIFGDGYFYLFGFSNDTLFGGDGDDIMMGEAGEASVNGANDAIQGEAGNDLLDGGGGSDTIYGGTGNDVIDGDHGNDFIVGGEGADTMLGSNAVDYGGATQGSDIFYYMSMADAGDSIYGFDTRAGDEDGIDLRALFDSLGYAGTTPRAAGTNLLQVVDSGGNALVQIDPDGAPGPQGFSTLVTLVGVNAATITDSFFDFQ